MADIDLSDFASIDPKQFAQLVKSASNDAARPPRSPATSATKVLGEIFSRMPALFRADRAGSTNAVIHWNIGDGPDGGVDTYELVIADGACTLSPTPEHEPKLALTLGHGRLPQGRLRQRQPGDDVHDRQAEGQGRPRPGREDRRPVRHPQGLIDGGVLPRPQRGAARPARLGARLRRRRGAPGRRRVGRARGHPVADHPGGREDRPVRLRVPRQPSTPTRPACPCRSSTRSCSGATPASAWRSWAPASRSRRSSATAPRSSSSSGCRSASATPPTRRSAAFCSTEPEAGSDVARDAHPRPLRRGHRRVGHLNGQKAFATNGGIANVHVVTAVGRPGPRLARPGRVHRAARHAGPRRREEAAQARPARLAHGRRVPRRRTGARIAACSAARRSSTSGWPGRARAGSASGSAAMRTFETTRPTVGAQAIGIARAAYEYSLEYAKNRVQFGRPIIENQAIAFALADMRMEIDAARLLVWRAAVDGPQRAPVRGGRGLDEQAQGGRGRGHA